MEINRFALHKIDHANNVITVQASTNNSNLEEYIKDILGKISKPDDKRVYSFPEGSLVEPALAEMLDAKRFSQRAENIANRLLTVELTTDEAMGHLTEIQRGILIQAVVEIDDRKKIILAKADFSGYLAENRNYQPEQGLPLKRKIFKAYCGIYGKDNVIQEVYVYDPFNTKYWWREFLELTQGKTDDLNTEIAFDEIDNVLHKFKDEFPADHNIIRNKVVGYFKTDNTQFSMSELQRKLFKDYSPVDSSFPLDKVKNHMKALSEKNKFDGQFTIVPEKVTAKKLREIIPLNDKMDLHIKVEKTLKLTT